MPHPVSTAVILAAGMGRRLGDLAQQKPKGFLVLDGQPIVERSLRILQAFGIRRILIVTGYQAAWYETLAAAHAGIHTVHNERYAESGSMFSLARAAGLVDEDFLLLESDLIYEKRAIAATLAAPAENCVLLSGPTRSGDEVYVEVRGDKVWNLSKKPAELTSIGGEFVGITKVSRAMWTELLAEGNRLMDRNPNVEYDSGCLAALAKRYPVGCLRVDDLCWAEIDDEQHLQRARQQVLPAIHAHDARHFPDPS